jgi:membrane AbrB-like protein
MAVSSFDKAAWRHTIEALLIAAAGGTAATYAGVPAPLISGSVLATALAAVAGRPLSVPVPLARAVFVIVGMALGAIVTPETLRGFAAYPLTLVVLAVSTFCMIAGTTFYLRKVHHWDALSALFGASPGALAQVMAMSAEAGADLRAIVIVQTIRVVMLTVGVPVGLELFGLADLPVGRGPIAAAASPADLALLVVVSVIPAFILHRLRFSGGWLFGAMLGSGLLHGGSFVHGSLPPWVVNAAMIALGAVTGARFANTSLRLLLVYLRAAFGSFAVAMAIAAIFMFVVTWMVDARPANVVIAFVPGGQDTMMVLALALHLDPVFVAVHQIARYLIVSASIPFLAGLIQRRR